MTSMEIDNNHHNDYLCKEDYYSFTEKEFEVANILLDLSNSSPLNSYPSTNNVITASNHHSNFPTWVSKKKRSLPYSPPPPPLPLVKNLLPEVTSPSSPHSFPPSEEPPHSCHNISIPSSKLKSKKLKSIYLEAIGTQQTLKKEIEGVKNHRNYLKAENYKLKAEVEIWRKGGVEESEKVDSQVQESSSTRSGAVKVQVHAGESTSTQVYNPPPLDHPPCGKILSCRNKQEKCLRGFDLNIPFIEEMEEGKVEDNIWVVEEKMKEKVEEKVEGKTHTQVTKFNRQRRMFILKNKKTSKIGD